MRLSSLVLIAALASSVALANSGEIAKIVASKDFASLVVRSPKASAAIEGMLAGRGVTRSEFLNAKKNPETFAKLMETKLGKVTDAAVIASVQKLSTELTAAAAGDSALAQTYALKPIDTAPALSNGRVAGATGNGLGIGSPLAAIGGAAPKADVTAAEVRQLSVEFAARGKDGGFASEAEAAVEAIQAAPYIAGTGTLGACATYGNPAIANLAKMFGSVRGLVTGGVTNVKTIANTMMGSLKRSTNLKNNIDTKQNFCGIGNRCKLIGTPVLRAAGC